MKNILLRKNLVYTCYLVSVTMTLLEIILRFYNPFHFRIKGENIILETNKQYVIHNNSIPVLEETIIHSKNSLGFRGPEMPNDFDNFLSIVTVGGSTTECNYLADEKTWSDQLSKNLNLTFSKVWLNNAGLAGHSSFGHQVLVADYLVKIKPDVILFLVGCNDVGREDLNESDESNMTSHYKNIFTFLSKKSELCNVIANLARSRKAFVNNLTDHYLDLQHKPYDTMTLSGEMMDKELAFQRHCLPAFKNRLQTIVTTCKQNQIVPVLLTQPTLFGTGKDSATGADLRKYKLGDQLNGELWKNDLELYNDISRMVAKENNIPLVDLAVLMPKKTEYFYDMIHFTNQGAKEVGDIVYNQLNGYFSVHYPEHKKMK